MGRKQIELSFYDKNYIIEYNRASVLMVVTNKSENPLDQVVFLIKGGLIMHHEKDMPTDDDIKGWVLALGDDLKEFAEALHELVQDVLSTFDNDRKNLKWGKVVKEA